MSLATLTELFGHYGYWIIFPISIVEGPIISIISGFLVSLGTLNIFIVFFILLLGDVVGDTLYYLFGRYAGHWFINHFGKFIGATDERISFVKKHFHKHDWKILLFGKTQALGSVLLFVAGVVKVNYLRFISYNVLGTIPKSILFLAIGFYFGKTYETSVKYVDYFSLVWMFLSIILILGYVYLKNYIKRNTFENEA